MTVFNEDPYKNLSDFANLPYKYEMSTFFYRCDEF